MPTAQKVKSMREMAERERSVLLDLLAALIDQQAARVLVPPYAALPGYWFGGGNLAAGDDGVIWLCGRYRNAGDSRTGLEAGVRGLECAILRSDDGGATFHKVCSWNKAELTQRYDKVISIEGTALYRRPDSTWEFYVSSERVRPYPDALASYQKPGTGVWSIDLLTGAQPDTLDAATLVPVLVNRNTPEYLHVKDPVVFDASDGGTALIFCSHPYSWSSSNSGLAIRSANAAGYSVRTWEVIGRGTTWDVAATRITSRLQVPRLGCFADAPPASVYLYDGAECLRPHAQDARAVRRPRGYSCEEIGGALVGWDAEFPQMTRLSTLQPLFVSPYGTGVSRYVDVLATTEGLLATWQQGQEDGSQPLVVHRLAWAEVERILRG